ncbi:hypothetical protein P691DRAFT_676098 [Macrolepiota fuliginosa MF-IS2]|uniref:Adenylate kinase n=1 Tax=Macrolepiota fuliginosa MF-IS2 TaxID=1400762 RepID=A0A9P5X651_9AGAR|nr:hypothetical protein P691DRAFT_676098 [Macrolepiota fuliginosa MF-IS2]
MSVDCSPPLLGDENGRYRVMVVGNSGMWRQSTLSAKLAKKLGVAHIPLDRLNWRPGWQEATAEELRGCVRDVLDKNPEGWVVDGNYARKIGMIVQDEATDIIWLDPPLSLYFPRLVVRTVRRLLLWEELCSPGCGESVKSVLFSRDSILWWCLTNHGVVRRRCKEMMSRIGLATGSDSAGRRMRRIGGWGGELKVWWRDVEALVHRKDL